MSVKRSRRSAVRSLELAVAATALLALAACTSVTDPASQRIDIAGGDTSGVYYSYASSIAGAAQSELGAELNLLETQGSVENLLLVSSGRAMAGFAQGDTAVDAALGEGSFSSPLSVLAAARVYDEYVHVVVPADSDARTLSDLAGRTVSLGAENSGVQVIAFRVLDAAGVSVESVTDRALGLEDSIAAMLRSDIEAFFWVGGLPTPGIERLENEMPIRLLSVGAEVVDRVNEGHAGVYQLADFPVGFYGLDGATVTMTVPNYLIVAEDAPNQLVHDLLRVLFDSRATIAQSVPAANYLDKRQAIFTGPIELHPGASEFYRETRR